MSNRPPRFFSRLLRWFCHPDLIDPIEGDLFELYTERVAARGKPRADFMFAWDVLLLLRQRLLKPTDGYSQINNYGIITNYLKVAIRSMARQKLYSAINIGGLAMGLTCSIVIFLFVRHELSYDRFLPDYDRIYRVYNFQPGNDFLGSDKYAVTPAALATALVNEYPEVAAATGFDQYNALLNVGDDTHYWEAGIFADESFFKVFAYPFVAGYQRHALKNPDGMVVTESLARKLFGHINVLGEAVLLKDKTFVVSGVMEDPPRNSIMQFSFVASILQDKWYREDREKEVWNSNGYKTFLKTKKQASSELLENKIAELIPKYWVDPVKYPQNYLLTGVEKIHLQNDINFDIGTKADRAKLAMFSIIAILVLGLAIINYMNLAIARSLRRIKEVGIRKVVGAQRRQLIFQFLCESFLITTFSTFLAVLVSSQLLVAFGELLGRDLLMPWQAYFQYVPYLMALILLTGLLAGTYPALVLTSEQTIRLLKGKKGGRRTKSQIQKGLIVGQYVVSTVMIIFCLVIYDQFQFIADKELGFQKEQIITIRDRGHGVRNHWSVIKKEWLSHPNILSVSGSQNLPLNIEQATIVNDDPAGDPHDDLHIYQLRADYDFLEVYEIPLLAGRYFSSKFSDSLNVCVLNVTAARQLGWSPQEAIGKEITEDWKYGSRRVIGVVQDFHMHSMHMNIAPLLIELRPPRFNRFLSVRVSAGDLPETIAFLEESMGNYSDYPFDYQFLSDRFNRLYQQDLKQGQMFGVFSLLAIAIASLGLFGLAAFNVRERVKELGIRKVLGASATQIITLVSKDLLRWVLLAFALGSPIAWHLASRWLADFAYHVDIHWWTFGLAGILMMFLALLTVGSHSLRAARTNPVDSLKDE